MKGDPSMGARFRLPWRGVSVATIALLGLVLWYSSRSPELPLNAFVIVGRTNQNNIQWQAIVQVSNALSVQIECGACSGPNVSKLSKTESSTGKQWRRIKASDPRYLFSSGLKPVAVAAGAECFGVRDILTKYREVQTRIVGKNEVLQFVVPLERTNDTRLVVFYREVSNGYSNPLDQIRTWVNQHQNVVRLPSFSEKRALVAKVLDAPPPNESKVSAHLSQ